MLNQIVIMGNVGRDAEVINTGEHTIAKTNVAVSRSSKGEFVTDWFRVVAFGAAAAGHARWGVKGTKVVITGSMQQNNYTDREGNKRTDWQLVINRVFPVGVGYKLDPAPEKPEQPGSLIPDDEHDPFA